MRAEENALDDKITEEEAKFIHRECSKDVIISGNKLHCFGSQGLLSVVNELYNFVDFGNHKDRSTAISILFKIGWTIGDEHQALVRRGWYISGTKLVSSTTLNIGSEEIALEVNRAAELGEVLSQKAIIEIAKRKLNGNYKDVC